MRLLCTLAILALAIALVTRASQAPNSQPPSQPAQQPPQTAPTAAPPNATSAAAPQGESQAPEHRLAVVVLDPAHGGTDLGARGTSGTVEKDVVLGLARLVRSELERLGFHTVLTREGDQNPSLDDRAAVANAHHGAIFITLHASSTGPGGTARAYCYEFSSAPTAIPAQASPTGAPAKRSVQAPAGWIEWDTAQQPFIDLSRRLADVLQVELTQKFPGSPEISSAAAVRELRSVAAPAAAVELSSVTVDDIRAFQAMAPALAAAIGRAVLAFRPIYESQAK